MGFFFMHVRSLKLLNFSVWTSLLWIKEQVHFPWPKEGKLEKQKHIRLNIMSYDKNYISLFYCNHH